MYNLLKKIRILGRLRIKFRRHKKTARMRLNRERSGREGSAEIISESGEFLMHIYGTQVRFLITIPKNALHNSLGIQKLRTNIIPIQRFI